MGMFDWLTGTKRPGAGVAPKPATEVRSALLAVNRPTAPFVVRDGTPEQVDLVAEWRIVDASWYEIFAKAGLKKVFKVLMRLDPQHHEVRAVDQEWSVEWRAGVPNLASSRTSECMRYLMQSRFFPRREFGSKPDRAIYNVTAARELPKCFFLSAGHKKELCAVWEYC
jgi:hypothetical protein